MFCSLLIWCSVALVDLLSFPTRRSSDLSSSSRTTAACSARGPGTRPRQVLLRPLAVYHRRDVRARVGDEGVDQPLRRLARDRKSTRLNSSHRCISYAVFCLKKKTPSRLL